MSDVVESGESADGVATDDVGAVGENGKTAVQEGAGEGTAPAAPKPAPKQEDPEWKTAKELKAASYKKFEEAAKERKALAAEKAQIQALLSDPTKLLKTALGPKLKEAIINELYSELENEKLSPEQRKLKEYEAKFKEQELSAKEQAEAREQTEAEEAKHEALRAFQPKIREALKESGLPEAAPAVKRIAALMKQALSDGYELSPAEIGQMVRDDITSEHKALYGQLDGSALAQHLGKENVDKLLKWSLEGGGKAVPGSTTGNTSAKPAPGAPLKFKSPAAYREWLSQQVTLGAQHDD